MTKQASDDDVIFLDLPSGRVSIECYPDVAPRHVARFKELVREGFFDGLPFYRVIDGFMAQTGNPRMRNGGRVDDIDVPNSTGILLAAEFSDIHHGRGIVSTARGDDPDSGDSEFFIMLGDSPRLDGQFTVWGRVIDGMEHVDALKKGDESVRVEWVEKNGQSDWLNGLVEDTATNVILSMRVAADGAAQDNVLKPYNPSTSRMEYKP